MQKFFSFLGLFLTCIALNADEVYITNNSKDVLNVRWSTALSVNARSSSGAVTVKPDTENYKAGTVSWLVSRNSEEAKRGIVYSISVMIYDDNHGQVGEKTVQKTLNSDQLFGPEAENNLYISIDKKKEISIFVGD